MPETDWVNMLKALADSTRLRIVKELLGANMTVNQIGGAIGVSQYNVSKHLRILRQAGIIDGRSIGTHREYFIVEPFRRRLRRAGNTLDLGCCTFRFDQLPD
ncbi:MAG: metalloregulator ArsR/SmtB family transcription factor [Verrucomicrobiota bacterium]|nr:metalloregulator ArsR/SmtB family transcription factor [Verrucomicrobiota bacterium]